MKEQTPCQTCAPYFQEKCARVVEVFGQELCIDPSLLDEYLKMSEEEKKDLEELLLKSGSLE